MAYKKVKITQIKSAIGYRGRAKATLSALGIRRMNSSIIKEESAAVKGMITSISHLLKVEEIS